MTNVIGLVINATTAPHAANALVDAKVAIAAQFCMILYTPIAAASVPMAIAITFTIVWFSDIQPKNFCNPSPAVTSQFEALDRPAINGSKIGCMTIPANVANELFTFPS